MNIFYILIELVVILIGVLILLNYKRMYLYLFSRAESKWDHFAIGPFWNFELTLAITALILIIAGSYNLYLDLTNGR